MSPDVIKSEDFTALYSREDDPVSAPRYSSIATRLEELEERLETAAREHRQEMEREVARAREEAERTAAEAHDAAVRALRGATEGIADVTAATLETAQQEVVGLAISVAAKILRREISADDQFTTRLVRRCLRKIVRESKVQVRVHPEDREIVEVALEDAPPENGIAPELTVVADRRVERGGAVVETPDFIVDGTVATQLAAAREAVNGAAS